MVKKNINIKNIRRVKNILHGVFRKLPQSSISPAAPHPGYSISEDRLRYCRSDGSAQYRRDGDIQALLGAAELYIYFPNRNFNSSISSLEPGKIEINKRGSFIQGSECIKCFSIFTVKINP